MSRYMHRIAARQAKKFNPAHKRYPIINQAGVAAGAVVSTQLIWATGNPAPPANLSSIVIAPGSKVSAVHLDFSIYQNAIAGLEGFAFWALVKNPGNNFVGAVLDPQTVDNKLEQFVLVRGGMGQVGGSTPYRVSGWFKLHRHSVFMNNDTLELVFKAIVAPMSMAGACAYKWR